jgi:predicted RNA-binding Zn ribbon-like protein
MSTFLFIANDPPLDFANTQVIIDGVRTDLLQSFPDLTEWFEKARLTSPSDRRRLNAKWAGTKEGKGALAEARKLRGILRASIEKVVRTGRVPPGLAAALSQRLQNPRLTSGVLYSQGRLKTESRWVLERPRDLLVPLAYCAADFFSRADFSAIRKCENPECILFFYDTSKNHSRRWCSMDLCGNRAKVSAFRRRLCAESL